MSYTIADLKGELTGTLHGTTLNQVVGLDVLLNRAARAVLADVDPIETMRILPMTSPIFDRIFDYAIPVDVKGDRVVDIRPQVNRTVADRFLQVYNEPFDAYKMQAGWQPMFTIQYNTSIKSIRIEKCLPFGVLVNGATSVTGSSGTWSAGGTALNLGQNNLNFVYGGSSLEFNVAAGANPSDAWLENSTMDAIDLTVQSEQGFLFLYTSLPTPSAVNNITLRWGSSATDYWERTVTQTQFNTAFQQGWNLLQFDWHGATVVGSPNAASITYLRFNVNYDGGLDFAYYLNDITCQLGMIYQIEYYSKFLFRDAVTGAFQETVTDDSNIINLDTDSYNVLFNQVAYLVAQQVQGADSQFDASYWLNEYNKALMRYTAKIKSQVLKPTQSYYKVNNGQNRANFVRYSSG